MLSQSVSHSTIQKTVAGNAESYRILPSTLFHCIGKCQMSPSLAPASLTIPNSIDVINVPKPENSLPNIDEKVGEHVESPSGF